MEEELEYLNERIDELELLIMIRYPQNGYGVIQMERVNEIKQEIQLLKNIRTKIKVSKECLEQVNTTLERHGKIDANTDLHNKIREIL